MKREIWQKIKDDHPEYWSDRIRLMPDGYSTAIDQLFRDVEVICAGRQLIQLDLYHYAGAGIVASMRPRTDVDNVTDDQKARLFDLMKSWSKAGDQICQVCGHSPVSILKYMDERAQEILCAEHLEERRSADV